ncbi:PhoD-like phosphatase N-terminal domain-containing protein [Streptomyces flaveolus]|uniref:alkaline phosphatase D family protein n=1 Tax=Streptomyces flaveolus TaxID=67297 RepID=UPI003414AAAB
MLTPGPPETGGCTAVEENPTTGDGRCPSLEEAFDQNLPLTRLPTTTARRRSGPECGDASAVPHRHGCRRRARPLRRPARDQPGHRRDRLRHQEGPFTLGVASGDPLPDGVALWTRLALEPLAPFGGMDQRVHTVQWEIAADERFGRVVQRGTAKAAPEYGHSVHVDVRGLEPAREHYYRFRTGGFISPAGRTRTAPAPDQMPRD